MARIPTDREIDDEIYAILLRTFDEMRERGDTERELVLFGVRFRLTIEPRPQWGFDQDGYPAGSRTVHHLGQA